MPAISQLNHRPRRRRIARRRAAATVEFAICMPMIVLLVFGAVEATSMIFLKQSLQTAAYEASRQSIVSTTTDAQVQSRAANILNARRVRNFQITFPRGAPSSLVRGDLVSVRVEAPSGINSPLVGRFLRSRDLAVETVMMKE
ncbi:TadE family protein [Planctomycetaceae bacterium SH139]